MTFKNKTDLSPFILPTQKLVQSAPVTGTPVDDEIPATAQLGRDTSASSRHNQVGAAFSATFGEAAVKGIQAIEGGDCFKDSGFSDHYPSVESDKLAINLFSSVIGSVLGVIAVIIGKIIIPLLTPIYNLIAKKLGLPVGERIKIPNDNIWHRSFRTAGIFAMNLFTIPGVIIGWLYAAGRLHIDIGNFHADKFSISAGTLITGAVAGIVIGAITAVIQYFQDRKQHLKQKRQPESETADNKDELGIDSWSKRLKAGVVVGNQAGIMVGLIFAACTIPVPFDKSPLTSCIKIAFSAIGGVIGGLLSLVIGPALVRLDRRLKAYSWYRKFAVMADGNNTNNPPGNRIKAGLQLGGSIGAIVGFALGMLFPGVGNVIFTGFGMAIGSLTGAIVGYVSEPLFNYFRDNSVKELRTANPWSNRLRSGAVIGASMGLMVSFFLPALSPLIVPLCTLAGAVIFTAAEPLYVNVLTGIYGERIRDNEDLLQDRTGNPWSARLPIGCMLGTALGGSIGLAAGGPAGLLLGAGIGGVAGGLAGLGFTNGVRSWLRNRFSHPYNWLLNNIETLCGETKAESTPTTEPALANTNDDLTIDTLSDDASYLATLLGSRTPSPTAGEPASIKPIDVPPLPKKLVSPQLTPTSPIKMDYEKQYAAKIEGYACQQLANEEVFRSARQQDQQSRNKICRQQAQDKPTIDLSSTSQTNQMLMT